MFNALKVIAAASKKNATGGKIDTSNIPRGEWTATSWQAILNFAYAVAGIVAVVFIIRGAVLYLSSQGQPDKIRQGHQALTYAIIGLAVVILAAVLTNWLFAVFAGAAG